MTQASLFGDADATIEASIEGLVYQPEFLSRDEEEQLIAVNAASGMLLPDR